MDRHSDHAEPLKAVADSLQQLRPVANASDPAELFYRAGFAAGRAQVAGRTRRQNALRMAAAALIGCAIVAPASFRLGQGSGAPAVAEAESAVKASEHPETPSETPVAEPATPKSASPAPDEAAPAQPFVEPSESITSATESVAADSSRLDFWHRWIQLEMMWGGSLSESPAPRLPLDHVLTASHPPEALEQWLEKHEHFALNASPGDDRPKQNGSQLEAARRRTTLSVGDAKRWDEIARDPLGEQR